MAFLAKYDFDLLLLRVACQKACLFDVSGGAFRPRKILSFLSTFGCKTEQIWVPSEPLGPSVGQFENFGAPSEIPGDDGALAGTLWGPPGKLSGGLRGSLGVPGDSWGHLLQPCLPLQGFPGDPWGRFFLAMKHETPGKSRRYAKLHKINRMAPAQVGGNGRKAFPIFM